MAGGMHGREACMAGSVHGGGPAWQGGMHGKGASVAGVCAWQGGSMVVGGGHAWHTVNEWVVRIPLECILVFKIFLVLAIVFGYRKIVGIF